MTAMPPVVPIVKPASLARIVLGLTPSESKTMPASSSFLTNHNLIYSPFVISPEAGHALPEHQINAFGSQVFFHMGGDFGIQQRRQWPA